MYVIPSLKMVALRQGDSEGDRFDDNTFLSLLLTGEAPDSFTPATTDNVPGADLILRRLDQDGDGKIGRDEAGPQLRRWFGRLDTNRDGVLEASELRSILRRRSGMINDE
jgi:hypothetical protein